MKRKLNVRYSIKINLLQIIKFIVSEDIARLEDVMVDGEEYDTFRTKEELIQKIKFYLDNPEESKKIVKAGQEKIKNELTYEVSMENIIKKISDIL